LHATALTPPARNSLQVSLDLAGTFCTLAHANEWRQTSPINNNIDIILPHFS